MRPIQLRNESWWVGLSREDFAAVIRARRWLRASDHTDAYRDTWDVGLQSRHEPRHQRSSAYVQADRD